MDVVGNLNYLRVIAASSPYRGTPGTVPGRIEAEDFDEGGEGVAYRDTTPGTPAGSIARRMSTSKRVGQRLQRRLDGCGGMAQLHGERDGDGEL